MARDGKLPVSFHTAHGWVLRTDCDEIDLSRQVIGSVPIQIMPDGTGFKGEGRDGKARKGDLKVVIGITQKGEIFPLGSWAGTSWDTINKQWKEQEMKLPDGSILICDGEPGLSEAFAEYASEQQRCHWHINRDLYHAMYQDGGRKADSKTIQDALAGALAIELPQEDFQSVSEQEKSDIEARMEKTEAAIDQLIGYFQGHGYEVAATYMRRAKIGNVRLRSPLAEMGTDLSQSLVDGRKSYPGIGPQDQEDCLRVERQRRNESCENHIETVCQRRSMGGLLAKMHGYYRQRRHRRWKLQVFFTKFGTITKNEEV